MSAQIAASNVFTGPVGAGGDPPATPFTSNGSPAAPDVFKGPADGPKSEIGENKMFGSGTISPLTLSFQTGAPEHTPEGSGLHMHATHATVTSPSKHSGLQGPGVSACSPTQGGAAATPLQGGLPMRLEWSKATSLDSVASGELRFGSPRSCAQATADLQPMLVRPRLY